MRRWQSAKLERTTGTVQTVKKVSIFLARRKQMFQVNPLFKDVLNIVKIVIHKCARCGVLNIYKDYEV